VRALLIVNPHATSTTRLRRDVIASALASAVRLDTVQTRYRGHAIKLAAAARKDGCELVLTLGGDGTVNEAVNGLLDDGAGPATAAELPALAALPGGSANVFTRALGLPRDPVDAAGQILQALAERRERTIGLGRADGRYFTFNAGLGLDAEVVRAVQGRRARGRTASPWLYIGLALRQFYQQTDRKHPAITIELGDSTPGAFGNSAPGAPGNSAHGAADAADAAAASVAGVAEPVFLCIVSNTAPWTYLGGREVHASPRAGFDTGLDVFALRTLSSAGTFHAVGQMLTTGSGGRLTGRNVVSVHDQPCVRLRSSRPVAFQIDGEYVGERQIVSCASIPGALRVVV
jgi:diacylglycerol kinase family enzyme